MKTNKTTNKNLMNSAKLATKYSDLKNQFMNLADSEKFIISEIGFHNGLNFILISRLWQQHAPKTAQLSFIIFEDKALSSKTIQKINSKIPKYLSNLYKKLSNQFYLVLNSTTHRLKIAPNIHLNLIIGNIKENLETQSFKSDLWIINKLDNLKLNKQLIQIIQKNSNSDTMLLINNKFLKTRDISEIFDIISVKENHKYNWAIIELATLANKTNPKSRLSLNKPTPWFDKYNNCNSSKKVIIIGGGISGAATAYSLANREYKVTLYEEKSQLAMGASTIHQGMLYGNFSGNHTPILELSLAGYRYSHHLINSILKKTTEYDQCGLIQLAYNQQQLMKQQQILQANFPKEFCYEVNQKLIKKLSGIESNYETGLYFPHGLWVNIPSFVKRLANHPKIKIELNTLVTEIKYQNKLWHIIQNGKIIDSAANLVMCNSHQIEQFIPKLNIRKIRGQISLIKEQSNLTSILCGDGYITPNNGKHFTIGATFKFNNPDETVKLIEHQENLKEIYHISDAFKTFSKSDKILGQVGIRSSTTDYMPLVGPVADYKEFINDYKDLSKDSNYWIETKCTYLNGLFLNLGHGSKGILTAPLCGEIIADYIDNNIMPVSERIRKALHPNRIWLKQIIKSKHN